jgi:hypothetical protein
MKNELKVALYVIAGCIGIAVFVVLISFMTTHPQAVLFIVGLVVVVAALAFIYVVYTMVNRIHERHNQMTMRNLARQAELDRIEAARVERDRLFSLEERKLALEEQKIKLAAYQAQAVHVKHDHALVIRGYDGLDARVAYERVQKVAEVPETPDTELVSEAELAGLLASPRKVSALSLLQGGDLNGDDLVLGTGQDGQLIRKTWKQLMGILILGLMGGGKTNTSLWVLMQLILKGYRVALIDRHAKSDESTHARLKDFSNAYDTPVGDSPAAAARVVRHVRQIFEARRDRGEAVSYRLVLMIDEFSATMRALKDNTSDWQPVAIELAGLVEDLGYEGRKYGVHVMAAGQATNASRSGGTEIRDLFHTRIVHGMRARQAQNIGLTEDKQAIQKLETGQTIIDIEGKDDPFFCVIPEVTDEFKQAVLSRLTPRRPSRTLHKNTEFVRSSDIVQTEQFELNNEPTMNLVQNYDEPRLPELAQRVLDLRKAGMGKGAIIMEIWQAKKGGSQAYKQADDEYTQIVENLVTLGYLEA